MDNYYKCHHKYHSYKQEEKLNLIEERVIDTKYIGINNILEGQDRYNQEKREKLSNEINNPKDQIEDISENNEEKDERELEYINQPYKRNEYDDDKGKSDDNKDNDKRKRGDTEKEFQQTDELSEEDFNFQDDYDKRNFLVTRSAPPKQEMKFKNFDSPADSQNEEEDISDFTDGPKESGSEEEEFFGDVFEKYERSSVPKKTKRKFVIGGVNAYVGKYRWAAFMIGEIEPDWPLFCGASIINSFWLISAAHCFLSFEYEELFNLTDPNKWNVQAGQVFVTIPEGQRHYSNPNALQVKKIVLHPKYNPEKLEYDIALIKVDKKLEFGYYKTKINIKMLPKKLGMNWPKTDQNCIFVGWGCTTPQGLISERAQKVTLPIIEQKRCSETYVGVYDSINRKHEFCAGYYDSDVGICTGDSGSGLVCSHNNKYYLAGIASGTSGTRPGRYPGIFTRVSYFSKWITSVMGK